VYPRLIRAILNFLDRVAACILPPVASPPHQQTGRRGEEDAYFCLRELGHIIVARNYRTHRQREEIDLIGWDQDVLSFIEVKSRTTRDVKPPEARLIMPSNPSSRQWLGTTCAVFHQRASGASTLSAYIL